MTPMPQPVTVPAMPPVAAMPVADVISPAEAKFWQEQADRAPALIRKSADEEIRKLNGAIMPYTVGGVMLGSALGVATFTKHVPGKWKILSGAASLASLGFGLLMGATQGKTAETRVILESYANALEQSTELRQQLATGFSNNINAEDIQKSGLEKAVTHEAISFGMHLAIGEVKNRSPEIRSR